MVENTRKTSRLVGSVLAISLAGSAASTYGSCRSNKTLNETLRTQSAVLASANQKLDRLEREVNSIKSGQDALCPKNEGMEIKSDVPLETTTESKKSGGYAYAAFKPAATSPEASAKAPVPIPQCPSYVLKGSVAAFYVNSAIDQMGLPLQATPTGHFTFGASAEFMVSPSGDVVGTVIGHLTPMRVYCKSGEQAAERRDGNEETFPIPGNVHGWDDKKPSFNPHNLPSACRVSVSVSPWTISHLRCGSSEPPSPEPKGKQCGK